MRRPFSLASAPQLQLPCLPNENTRGLSCDFNKAAARPYLAAKGRTLRQMTTATHVLSLASFGGWATMVLHPNSFCWDSAKEIVFGIPSAQIISNVFRGMD